MSTLFSTIPERYLMIQRPIQLRIIQTVLDSLSLTNHFAVGYINDDDSVINPNSLLGEQNKEFKFNTRSTNRVLVNFEEAEEEAMQQSAGHLNILRSPLWYDGTYGLSLTPKTAELKGEATFSFLINGRNKAELFYNRLRRRLAITNQMGTNAEYRIPVSDEFLYIADEIRQLIANQFEPGLTTREYINRCVVGELVEVTDHQGKFSTLAFREVQNNILLQNLTLAKPEINRNEAGVFEVTLGVSYYYQVPIDYHINYPLYVGDSTVPDVLLDEGDDTPFLQFQTTNDYAFSEFAGITVASPLVTYPKWDTFVPPKEKGEFPFYSVIVTPEEDKVTLIDITEQFDKYNLSIEAVTFLITHLKLLNKPNIPLLGIKLFKNEDLMHWESCELTPDGIIKLKNPTPGYCIYRVVIYGLLNWTDISLEFKKDLMDNGKELVDILPVFLPDIVKEDIPLSKGGQMDNLVFEELVTNVSKNYSEKLLVSEVSITTVGLFHLLIEKGI